MLPAHNRTILFLFCAVALLFGDATAGRAAPEKRDATFRLESFAIGLDPAFIDDTQSRRIVDMLHARLVRSEPGGTVTSGIAESWEWVGPDTLRLQLRTGLNFSNGQAVTSTDASWSICRLLQPAAPTRWLFSNVRHELVEGGERAHCDGIRTNGPHSLEIEVDAASDRLLPALASTPAAIVPEGSEAGEYGVVPGAGPYEVEHIEPNVRVVLSGRQGGPVAPGFNEVEFRLVQDDATAAALFRAGDLDILEISNPTLYRLLVDGEELRVPGRLLSSQVDQVRLLIFNEKAIADRLGLSESGAQAWVDAFTARIDVEAIAQRFSPLLISMHTSYFPGHESAPGPKARRTGNAAEAAPLPAELTIVTENDPFSDSLAAAITREAGVAKVDYVGLEKSVLISRLINRQYEIASITLEAQMDHAAYWLSFFRPGSPFTVFGKPIEGLTDPADPGATDQNRRLIDERGNWFVFARERRFVLAKPRIGALSFHATGLLDYAAIKKAD